MNKINQMTSEGMSLQRAYLMACEDDRQQWWNSKSTNHKQRAEALGWLQPEQMPLKMWELLTMATWVVLVSATIRTRPIAGVLRAS